MEYVLERTAHLTGMDYLEKVIDNQEIGGSSYRKRAYVGILHFIWMAENMRPISS